MIFSWRPVPKGGGVVFRAFPQLPCLAKTLLSSPQSWLCQAGRDLCPTPPPATWGEYVSLFLMLCSCLAGRTGPNDISFQQVSGLPWGSRDCQLVASPSWSQEYIYGGRSQGVLCRLTRSVWWRTTCASCLGEDFPPCDVLIFPALFFCDLPNLLGSYTQWYI